MRKFVIDVENFKIFTIMLICLSKIHCALSVCTDDEWDCDDGSCIELSKKCDGIVDCKDRSDETAENCIHLHKECQSFAFTCTYGACITKSHRCNGIRDCADNSDELVCSETREKDLRGTCGAEELQCLRSKECIGIESICDGQRDCSDGSDETVEVCAEFKCSKVGFHCGYGGCINGVAKCNGTKECPDGSDEAWELCKTPRKISNRIGPDVVEPPTKRPTPTPTPRPRPTPTPTQTPRPRPTPTPTQPTLTQEEYAKCQVSTDIENAVIKLHPLNTTIPPGSWVEDTETIHVECTRAVISGSTSLFCDNGKFNGAFPTCSSFCDGTLLQGLSTRYHCYRADGHYLEPQRCNKKIPPDTKIEVFCASGYRRSSGDDRQIIKCLPNGIFDFKREKCDIECGRVQPTFTSLTRKGILVHPNDVPWHVGIYELIDGQYSFICGGSLISAQYIISAAHCFWDNENRKQTPVENYNFIAGKYTRQYSTTPDELIQLQKAESIQISTSFLGKQNYNYADVALIKLKEPLIFNDNISAVCLVLSEGAGTDYVTSGTLGAVTGYGQNNTLEKVPMKTKAFHTCLADPDGEGLTNDKFCLVNEGDMSICRGDSGGGFVVKENGGLFNIWGIISYTPSTQLDCARSGFVGVTNVRYIKPDLREKIKFGMHNNTLIF